LVGNVLYIGSFSGNLYALNSSTGATIWKSAVGGGFFASPLVANGTIYIGNSNGIFYAIQASTGKTL
jgi:outer membrane protein assembly factor BamB